MKYDNLIILIFILINTLGLYILATNEAMLAEQIESLAGSLIKTQDTIQTVQEVLEHAR